MEKSEVRSLGNQLVHSSRVAMPHLVGLCSLGRNWSGIEVWQQTCTLAEETALPALAVHHVLVQREGAVHIAQRREGRVHRACWRHNDLAIVPAGAPSAWQIKGAPDLIRIDIDCELLNRVVQETFDTDPSQMTMQAVLHANDPEIGLLAQMLLRETQNCPSNGKFYAQSLASVLAVQLVAKYSSLSLTMPCTRGSLPKPILDQCVDYIHANLEANLSLDRLAKVVGYSTWHFARLFKESMGIAPHRYVLDQRIDRAKTLLQTTSLSQAEISLLAGFVDQSHLARVFRAHVGMLPREFRQKSVTY